MTTTEVSTLNVYQAWAEVMGDVQAIGKKERNEKQRFNFRGIDAVMNAVGPALRAHGVMVIPNALDLKGEIYTTGGGTQMRNSTVHVAFTVIGPGGDEFTGSAYGEASDAGDKSVSKAHSVAYRTFLLQALCIKTDERDPDADVYERAAPQQPSNGNGNDRSGASRLQNHVQKDNTAVNETKWGAPTSDETVGKILPAQLKALQTLLSKAGFATREEKQEFLERTTGHTDLASSKDLTENEASVAITALNGYVKKQTADSE